jgi:DNA-binding NtrC family response regulator
LKPVLVVEDDKDICLSLIEALNAAGYFTTGASTVEDAQRKMKNQTFACLVIDLRLGEGAGEDLVAALRSRPDLQNLTTPVLIVSAHINEAVVARLKGKIQGALVKPVMLEALQNAVKRLAG